MAVMTTPFEVSKNITPCLKLFLHLYNGVNANDFREMIEENPKIRDDHDLTQINGSLAVDLKKCTFLHTKDSFWGRKNDKCKTRLDEMLHWWRKDFTLTEEGLSHKVLTALDRRGGGTYNKSMIYSYNAADLGVVLHERSGHVFGKNALPARFADLEDTGSINFTQFCHYWLHPGRSECEES